MIIFFFLTFVLLRKNLCWLFATKRPRDNMYDRHTHTLTNTQRQMNAHKVTLIFRWRGGVGREKLSSFCFVRTMKRYLNSNFTENHLGKSLFQERIRFFISIDSNHWQTPNQLLAEKNLIVGEDESFYSFISAINCAIFVINCPGCYDTSIWISMPSDVTHTPVAARRYLFISIRSQSRPRRSHKNTPSRQGLGTTSDRT